MGPWYRRRMIRAGARLLLVTALVGLALTAALAPAAAAAEGSCTAAFNGVEASRIDSLSSPLLLGADQALVFAGTDPAGTRTATVAVLLGPATLGREEASSQIAAADFYASLDLAEVAPYGVGLVRVRATTDHCTVEAWLRIGGRLPLTTLVGVTGTGLAVVGLAAQAIALIARRRWSPPLAAAAGVATGAGGALLGQQLGRLQLSYWSLGGSVALAVVIGLALALLLRSRDQEEEAAPRSRRDVGRGEEASSAPPRAIDQPSPAAANAEPRRPAREAAATPAPAGPFWCYVMGAVEVLHLDDYTRVVATLQPGNWYLAKREASGWAQVVAGEGVEGWVPRQALHRAG